MFVRPAWVFRQKLTSRDKYDLVFAKLPINTPWLYLYREKYPPGPTFKERTDEYETI